VEVTIVRSKQVPQVVLNATTEYWVTDDSRTVKKKFTSISEARAYAKEKDLSIYKAVDGEIVEGVTNKRNEKTWPSSYKCNFLEPGIVSYEDVGQGIALLKKESMDTWINSFKGKPVIIDHQNVSPANFKETAVGYITNVLYNSTTGWYDAEFIITDDEGHEAIKNGYSVSCSFDVKNSIGGGEWHASKYDEEITKGEGLHLALVTSPRYEDCRIVVNSKRAVVNTSSEVLDDIAFKLYRKKYGDCTSEQQRKVEAEYKSYDDSKKATVQNEQMEVELNNAKDTFTCDACGQVLAISKLSKSEGSKNYCGQCVDAGLDESIKKYKGNSKQGIQAKIVSMASEGSFDRSGIYLAVEEEAKREGMTKQEVVDLIDKTIKSASNNKEVTLEKKNGVDFSVMSPIQVDKYMETLSDVGIQSIIDGDFPGDIKKLAEAHVGDRAKKLQAEEIAGATGQKPIKKKEASKMWGLFAKKADKASITNDKIDATKVFVKVDNEMVPLSTLMNSVGSDFELLQESDAVKINGKDVSVADLVAAYKTKSNEFPPKKEKEEEEKEVKKDAKEEEELKKKEIKEDGKKCDKCGAKLNEFPPEKDKDKDKEKDNETLDPDLNPDVQKEKKNSKENGKEFFMELENAKENGQQNMNDFGSPTASIREDKAAQGKKFFGSKKR